MEVAATLFSKCLCMWQFHNWKICMLKNGDIVFTGHNKSQRCSVVLPPACLTYPWNDLYDKKAPSAMVFCFPINSGLSCAQKNKPSQSARPQLAPEGEQAVYAVWRIASIASHKAQRSSLWSVTREKNKQTTTPILNFFILYVTIFSYITGLTLCPTLFALLPSLKKKKKKKRWAGRGINPFSRAQLLACTFLSRQISHQKI